MTDNMTCGASLNPSSDGIPALGYKIYDYVDQNKCVLILLLMEYPLWDNMYFAIVTPATCLNPSSDGIPALGCTHNMNTAKFLLS